MYRGTFNCVAEFLIEVIITNLLVGGGVPEHRRALELSQLLGVNIYPKQGSEYHSSDLLFSVTISWCRMIR